MTRRLLFAAVFFSLAWATLPSLVKLGRQALALRELSMEQRRAKVMGPFYESMARLRTSIPPTETVAVILRQPIDITPALFFNYYIYPHPTRLFDNLRAYRDTPQPPRRIVRADQTTPEQLREMAYEEVRAEIIGLDYISPIDLPEETIRDGLVPVVASVGGAGPDSYTTEAVMANPSDAPVRVVFELLPSRQTAEVVLGPGQRVPWNDFVYEVFDRNVQGWMRFRADGPVRARFWIVNRGRRDAVALPFRDPVRHAEFNAPSAAKLWILNPNDRAIGVSINSVGHGLPALEWAWLPKSGPLVLTSDDDFVAYVSWRDSDGGSRFAW